MLALLLVAVNAAPAAESHLAPPDLFVFTKFCSDLGYPSPIFENGCYSVPDLETRCEMGKLTELFFLITQVAARKPIDIYSRIDWPIS